MSDKPKPPETGKTFRGQKFPPIRTAESVQRDVDAQKPFNKPDAVAIEVYFAVKGIRNPVSQAAMRAYTNIKRATVADWDAIFSKF
jgi:hypothetical protein